MSLGIMRELNKMQSTLNLFSSTPRSIIEEFSPEMAQRIQEILAKEKFDLIIASQLGTAIYGKNFLEHPAIFEELEMGVLYEEFTQAKSNWQKFRSGLTWEKHRRYVKRILKNFELCTVVSEQEKQLVSNFIIDDLSVDIIPNFITFSDFSDFDATPEQNRLIFTGPFRYFANHDAMVWFLREIYPKIQAQVPDVQLFITGDNADLPLPEASNVTLTGFVEDVRPLIASSSANIVPMRVGAGTRLKILEAMALGVPVVSTSKGAEGLDVKHGEHLLIADSAQGFAKSVVLLLRDAELRSDLITRARNLVERKYDMKAVMPQFEKLIQRVAQ